jgi:hypothetical protein
MRSCSIALALLLTVGCAADGTVGPELIPPDAPELSRFDGVWLSETFGFVITIEGRLGTVTFSNSDTNPVGETILVIQSEEDTVFSGLQVFSNGEVTEVLGRLVDPVTLRMIGGGISWELLRIDDPGRETVSEDDIPEDAPAIDLFDGEWLSDALGYAVEITGRLGTVTFSSVEGVPLGETLLVIQSDTGPRFTGLQVFDDGLRGEVFGELIDADTLRITGRGASSDFRRVSNAAPVAGAIAAGSVASGSLAVLDASGSTDRDLDDVLSYAWTQEQGEMVALSSTEEAVVTFVAPSDPQVLRFRVTVTDLAGAQDEAEVLVIVTPSP